MIMIVAVVGVVLLNCLAVLQVVLAAGAPLGRYAWGGRHDVLPLPLRIGSAVSILLYAFFALVILQAAGAVEVLPDDVADVAIWVLAGYFALGVVMNAASRSRPERMVMTPVALVLAAVCAALALS